MKGDFTRFTFRPDQHYSSVRMQQGRVQVDSDWNEQLDINAHRTETETVDVIGDCGGPLAGAGFALSSGLTPHISAGRYYVAGLLCENETDVALDQQPDLPGLTLPTAAGLYLAYLDVWQRHITALEDVVIREVALGGPDTATRIQTVWQVKLLGPLAGPLHCLSEPAAWQALVKPSSGKLQARAQPSPAADNPCVVPPEAGYRRLENQLYRIEIHQAGPRGTATFKWSRDNGSITTAWLEQNGADLIVQSSGRDKFLGFGAGQTVELSDDARELQGQAGLLVRLGQVEGQILSLDPTDPNTAGVAKADFPDTLNNRPNHPKVRRWDSPGAVTTSGTWTALEDGVEVRFEAGDYQVGDYWLIPARTATGDVEWPVDAATPPQPLALPPAGITHHYCRLAVLQRTATEFQLVEDCRRLFPPLTGLINLLYESGDGQEAGPGQALPHSLRVRVANGQTPVIGARVRFTVVAGGGTLSVNAPVATVGPHGIAECAWTLGPSGPQQVEAALLDAAGQPLPGQIVHFNANLDTGGGGGCCVSVGAGGQYARLDEAIKDLLDQGRRELCLCLLPGDHRLASLEVSPPDLEVEVQLKISGCGRGSRLVLEGPLRFEQLKAVTWRDLALELAFAVEVDGIALAFDRCAEVTLSDCHLSGFIGGDGDVRQGVLLSLTRGDRIRLRDNVIEAARMEAFQLTRTVFQLAQIGPLVELFSLPEQGVFDSSAFRQQALRAAAELAALNQDERNRLRRAITEALGNADLRPNLSQAEIFTFGVFGVALAAPQANRTDLLNGLLDLRRAAVKARPGVAVVVGGPLRLGSPDLLDLAPIDEDDYAALQGNEISGVLSLYGVPAPAALVQQLFTPAFLRRVIEQLRSVESRIFLTGLLGTFQVQGNQLVRLDVAQHIVEQLHQTSTSNSRAPIFGLFGRCLVSHNVFEGASLIIAQHLAATANEFSLSALPSPLPGQDASRRVALVIADSTVYVGNHGRPQNVALQDVSRTTTAAANLELTVG
jgi:hypothetical protein